MWGGGGWDYAETANSKTVIFKFNIKLRCAVLLILNVVNALSVAFLYSCILYFLCFAVFISVPDPDRIRKFSRLGVLKATDETADFGSVSQRHGS